MPRKITLVAVIIIIFALLAIVLGSFGLFPPPRISVDNTAHTETNLNLVGDIYSNGQGNFVMYSVLIRISTDGQYDLSLKAKLASSYGGYPAGTVVKESKLESVDSNGGNAQFRLDGAYTTPVFGLDGNMPLYYELDINRIDVGPINYNIAHVMTDKNLMPAGLVLLVIGIAVLLFTIVKKPTEKAGRRPQVIISPTLGSYGYSGDGTGTAGRGIQHEGVGRKSKVGAKKRKRRRDASAAASAGSAPCPFCGKAVPRGAYYCPSCYGKIK